METLGKVVVGVFIGGIINAIGLFCLGLLSDYQRSNIRTFAPVGGIIIGFFLGCIIGGIASLIQSTFKNSSYVVLGVSIICISLIFIAIFLRPESVINSGNSQEIVAEMLSLIGIGVYIFISMWIVTKIVSSGSFNKNP